MSRVASPHCHLGRHVLLPRVTWTGSLNSAFYQFELESVSEILVEDDQLITRIVRHCKLHWVTLFTVHNSKTCLPTHLSNVQDGRRPPPWAARRSPRRREGGSSPSGRPSRGGWRKTARQRSGPPVPGMDMYLYLYSGLKCEHITAD